MNILYTTPPRFQKNDFVVLDLEIFGAEKKKLHRPTDKFALCSFTHKDTVWMADTSAKFAKFYQAIGPDPVLVFHNAKFDITQLRRWTEIKPRPIWDTMLIEKLLWSGYYDRFALGDLTRRYLNFYMDKSIRDTFEDATEVTPEQIQYAAEDGIYTYQVLQEQIKLVKGERSDVFKVWKEIDMPALWAFMDFQGFRVDVDAWYALAKENKCLADEAEAHLDFNPRSPQQVVAALKKAGFQRLPNSQAVTIDKWLRKFPDTKAAELAYHLLNYKNVYTLHSRYGKKFIDPYKELEEDYWVIHASYSVTGAETGRPTAKNPSMNNIPAREHPEFRQPWIARPGNKLIVSDWSAQEARGHAFYTQDPTLLKIFQDKLDVYAATYNLMYQANITKKDPQRNDVGKPSFLGATYGQTPEGVADRYNMSLDAAEDMQARFWKTFPQSYQWCEQQKKKKNWVETAKGRRFWLNPYSSQCGRNALNHPHQGLGADMMKQAIGVLHQEWKWDIPFGIVAEIYDEMILDVPEQLAPEIAKFVTDIMEQVGNEMTPGVRHQANAVICGNWLEGK